LVGIQVIQDPGPKSVYKGLFKITAGQSPEQVIFQKGKDKISPEQVRSICGKIDFLCIFTEKGKNKTNTR
jgi:hypothetical protein